MLPRLSRSFVSLMAIAIVLVADGRFVCGQETVGGKPSGRTRTAKAARTEAPLSRPVPKDARAPYPPSEVLGGLEWAAPRTIVRLAPGSDNWPLTWADDGDMYGAYGDGRVFAPFFARKLSIGLARVAGGPADPQGHNLRAPTIEQAGDGAQGQKASGILMVDGVLYQWLRNAANSQLAWSNDHGQSWRRAEWKWTTSFGSPTFLNYGSNYAGAMDDFVYVYSSDSPSAYEPGDRMVLARVARTRIREREQYQFFVRVGEQGQPEWTTDLAQRGAVFSHPGRCYRTGITFHPKLRRYLLCQVHPESDHSQGPRFHGGFGVYEAPYPWGPWRTVYFTNAWDVGPGETSSFPTKWMSDDGLTVHLVFSGDDCFSVRRATFKSVRLPTPDH